jgi:hypothetical protein
MRIVVQGVHSVTAGAKRDMGRLSGCVGVHGWMIIDFSGRLRLEAGPCVLVVSNETGQTAVDRWSPVRYSTS